MAKRKGSKKKVTASSTAPTNDYLSALPVELLRKVLHHLPSSSKLIGAVSKSLQPLLDEILYERPTLVSYGALDKLCATVNSKPERGKLVRELNIEIPFAEEAEEPGDLTKEQPAPTSNSMQKDFLFLLTQMTTCTKLVVEGSSRLVQFVLAPQVAANALPQLEYLMLRSTFSMYKDPFSPALYSALAFFENLEDIVLIVERLGRSIKPFSKPPMRDPPLLFPSLARLLVEGPLSRSEAATSFLRSFGDIFHLSLGDRESVISPVSLLRALNEPEFLFRLRIESSTELSYDSDLEDVLVGMQDVERLELAGGSASARPSLYDALRKMPSLKHLTFGPDAPASTDELAALIAGPRKHTSLEHLTLDITWGKMGTRIEEDKNWEFYDPGDGPGMWGVYPDWIPPTFTDTFSREGLKKLVRIADQVGFNLDGDAIDAIPVDEAFEGELDTVTGFEMAAEEFM